MHLFGVLVLCIVLCIYIMCLFTEKKEVAQLLLIVPKVKDTFHRMFFIDYSEHESIERYDYNH